MAYDTEEEITTAVSEKEEELAALRTRMTEDFDLWALTDYTPTDADGNKRAGYQAYTSSQPRNFFDKVLDGLNQAALTIQILLPEKASQEDRRKASTGELFLFGALAAVDRRLAKRGEPPLREGLGYFMCLRGLYAVRALVYVPKGQDEVVFDVQPWDPLHVTWEMGSDGPIWVAYKHQISKAQALSEYGLTIETKTVEVIDWWDAERNAVIVGEEFGKKPTAHNIGHVPVMVRHVGSMPTVQGRTFESTVEYQGDSVWSASRDLYAKHNKYISDLMDIHERAIVGSLIHESKDGRKSIEGGDPYRSWQEMKTEEGEKIYPLELPAAPPETAAILGMVSNDIQQSSLPYPLAYGGTQQAMSGRALSVLSDATRSVYTPRTGAMAQAYTWLSEELLTQFVSKGSEIELRGFNPKLPKEKQFFAVKAGPDAINPDWFINVVVEPQMPRDVQADIEMALAVTQKRGPDDIPLMSKATARETRLMLQDPDAEEDKVLAEMGKALPPIVAANVAAALKRRGEEELAQQVMMLLRPPQAAGQAAPQLPPELIEAVVAALVASGQKELAAAFVQALAGQGAPQPQGPGVVQTPIAPSAPPAPEMTPAAPGGAAPPGGGMMGMGGPVEVGGPPPMME